MSNAGTPPTALPTHRDLPCEDGKHKESSYHPYQSMFLTAVLTPWLVRRHPDGNYLIGADNGVYWDITDAPLDGCIAPDWFYVPGVPKFLDGWFRRSYVLWQEHVPPAVVFEYVSGTGAEEHDRTPRVGKWWVYEQAVKAEYYVIRDPYRDGLEVYRRVEGEYRPVPANTAGRYLVESLGVEIGRWKGKYCGVPWVWLRAWEPAGGMLPLPEERAEYYTTRADAANTRADALAARLRALGVDPDAP